MDNLSEQGITKQAQDAVYAIYKSSPTLGLKKRMLIHNPQKLLKSHPDISIELRLKKRWQNKSNLIKVTIPVEKISLMLPPPKRTYTTFNPYWKDMDVKKHFKEEESKVSGSDEMIS